MLFEIIIIINIFLILNVLIFYPVIIYISAKLFKKPIKKNEDYEPEISIIIAAYNEEKLIQGAIESIYNSNYPLNKIKVLVGSDGSTDKTVDVVKELTKTHNTLEIYELNRIGKNNVLNYLVSKSDSEVIFYMDADLRIQKDTFKKLLSVLSDDSVGAVMAALKIYSSDNDSSAGGFGESVYQKYERFIRKNESDIYSNINSLGLYAIKREVYTEIPNDKVCDDFFRMLETAFNRKRVIYDSDTIIHEVREKSTKEEMLRRVRLVAGGLSTVFYCKKILNPKYGWASFFIWNHKILRWLLPIYMILISLFTIFLAPDSYLFIPLVYFHILFYGGALLGWILEKVKINFFPFRILLFAISMNIGFLLGIIRFLRGGQNAIWGRTVNN
jgi:cellulose synthase/poly-beta-1,6-N-acetylglucosamine synthase-like glycosyltransferase